MQADGFTHSEEQDEENYSECREVLDNQQRFWGGSHITNTAKFYESNKLIVVVVTQSYCT